MENLDYHKIYALQDIVLNVVFMKETEFYLTGGTCLNRFFWEKRYSDDLDFFTNFSNTFHYSFKELLERFDENEINYEIKIESKDFLRIVINKNKIDLQVDIVNDRVKRFEKLVNKNNYILDNPLNILSNKLIAVLGRDNPKDVFDIVLISDNLNIEWRNILAQASEKMVFQKEDLVYRLSSFPVFLLQKIKFIDKKFVDDIPRKLKSIINEIIAV